MKAMSQFVVRVFDLIEAEGADLRTAVRAEAGHARRAVSAFALGAALLLAAIPLFLAGVGLIGAGFTWWLENHMGRPLAFTLTGAALLLTAGACVACFSYSARRTT